MNTADSIEMSAALNAKGMNAVSSLEEADIVLVNTCTVRQQAEHRALSLLGRLKEWKTAREGRLVILTGCAAERIKDEVHWRMPQVDLTVGAKDIDRFSQRLDELLGDSFDWRSETSESFTEEPSPAARGTKGFVAYVTIMRGCNYSCSYCIVPAVRGREIYRPLETILGEVKAGVESGAKETLLLGQTVNSYHHDGRDFSELLTQIDRVPGLKRTRFISPHPHYMNTRTIDTIATLPTVCEHVHLPVQSGSDLILKRMRRNYDRVGYIKAVNYLREKIPNVSVTTDLIVGFPGETEEDFKQTLTLVGEIGFDSAYCFKYSPRPGTTAAESVDDVPRQTKEERLARLLEATEAQAARRASQMVGSVQEILTEEILELPDTKGIQWATGRTRGNWNVRCQLDINSIVKPGDLVAVKLTAAHGRSLEGNICSA